MAAATEPTKPTRLLIVDDNRELARVLSRVLGLGGLEVRIAHSAATALDVAAAFAPEVALIDIGMPEIDGYVLASSLRAATASDALYLIGMSGFVVEGVAERARAAGFDDLLSKPLNAAEITGRISKWRARAAS